MKTKFALLIALLISISTFAQQGINYKALIKDDLGNVMANELIEIQFTILTGISGVYQETHSPTTDNNGIVIVNIGEGIPSAGSFDAIDWAEGSHFLNVQINTGEGLTDMGTTEFMAVPYAKHAETAGNVATKIDDLSDGKSNENGYSLFIGVEAGLNASDTNIKNVGLGYRSLYLNINGQNNTANGFEALRDNSTGSRNTAIGCETLQANTEGISNTAVGSIALKFNTTGERNTAIGQQALWQNISGIENTAVGENALENNSIGNYNTAIGQEALERNTDGNTNTVIGREALQWNLSGSGNIAIGQNSGRQNSTGSGNIFIGNNAGDIGVTDDNNKLYINNSGSNTPLIYGEFDTDLIRIHGAFEVNDGSNNRFKVLENGKIGINTSDPQSLLEVAHQNGGPTPSNLTNAISIKNSNSDKSWQFHVNNLGALVLYRNGIYTSYFHETSGAYVTVSDRRLKNDITPLDNGTLNKVMQLNPVSYLMKDQKDTKRNLGLISQEVQKIFPSITHYVEAQDILSLSYTELIPILIKALQEQQEIINAQNAKDIVQDKSIEALVTRLNLLEAKSTN